jgi:hypothetical protein
VSGRGGGLGRGGDRRERRPSWALRAGQVRDVVHLRAHPRLHILALDAEA